MLRFFKIVRRVHLILYLTLKTLFIFENINKVF